MRGITRTHRKHAGHDARPRGFTLVESMMACALLLVLAMMAAPSFATWQQRTRLDAGAQAFLASLAYARSEAIRRGVRTAVTHGDVDTRRLEAQEAADDRAVDWSAGWTIVADTGSGPLALRMQARIAGVQIRGAAADVRFTPPAGQVVGGFRSFELMSAEAASAGHEGRARRCIAIAAGGRARIRDGGCGARA